MNNIYEILENLNIHYTKYEHHPLHTVADSDEFFKTIEIGEFWKNKNLFLRNDKKNKYILVTLQWHKRLDIKYVAEVFGEKRLSFASDDDLFKFLKLTPGSVSPFGLANDSEKTVSFALDKSIFEYEKVLFHPNINTTSLEISINDFKKYLEWLGKDIIYVDIE